MWTLETWTFIKYSTFLLTLTSFLFIRESCINSIFGSFHNYNYLLFLPKLLVCIVLKFYVLYLLIVLIWNLEYSFFSLIVLNIFLVIWVFLLSTRLLPLVRIVDFELIFYWNFRNIKNVKFMYLKPDLICQNTIYLWINWLGRSS